MVTPFRRRIWKRRLVVHVVVERGRAYDRWQKQARSGGVGLIYIYIYIYMDYREAHTGVVYELSRQYDRPIERKYYHPFHENIMTPEVIKYECKLKQ